jgi:UDP-N-acetylmuramate dehydrogenase
MNIEQKVSLRQYNTFGIDVTADYMSTFANEQELLSLLGVPEIKSSPKLLLGGGSNILFTRNFSGAVLKNNIQGIEIISEDDANCYVKAGAGVNWHSLVLFSIDKNLGGIENLSLIPGNTGAAPIQNIGAYGVELKDSFLSLEAINIDTCEKRTYVKEECEFGYRDSIFKRQLKGKIVIVSVTLALKKIPELNITYGAIGQELKKSGISAPTVKDISEAVSAIRRSKLPNPAVIGNAGSFFKNPELTSSIYAKLVSDWPNVVAYALPSGSYKIAAGWLIEQCGWKGKVVGNTGTHKDQALVLVNHGNASGSEILDLAMKIQLSVKEKFGVTIEPEVNII